MNIESFITNLEEAIDDFEPESLTPDTRFRELPEWSSVNALLMLAMIFNCYQVSVNGTELAECHTVQDLYDRVDQRLKVGA